MTQLIKCLICEQNCNIEQLKDNCDENESSLISKHLQVIFLLRNILEVPSSKLVIFLKSHPKLELWLSLCDNCTQMVNNCKITYQSILEQQRNFRTVKQGVIKLLKESALIKQEIILEEKPFHDKHINIVEQIRGFVYQNRYPKNIDPFISGDHLAYQHLSNKLDKALEQLEEEVDYQDNQSIGSNDPLQVDDDWSPSENEHHDKSSSLKKSPARKRKDVPPTARLKKYKRGLFSCPHCPKNFPFQIYLNRHIKFIHDQRLSSACPTCGSQFPDNSTLSKHITKCSGNSIPCPLADCPRKFDNHNSLTRHLRDTHGSTKTEDPRRSCSFCGKYFPKMYLLEKHIRRVHSQSENKFKCDLCGVGRISSGDLKKHQENCKGESIICPEGNCGMRFSTSLSLNYHVKITHKEKMDVLLPFKCENCGDGYLNNEQLRNHRLKKHRGENGGKGRERSKEKEKGPWVCETCGGTYLSRQSFTKHRRVNVRCVGLRGMGMEMEGSLGGVICEICGGRFRGRGSLAEHVKMVHERRFNLKCEICGQGKNGRWKMEIHMWQKHRMGDGGRWACGVEGCGVKGLYGRRDREDHARKHRGEEPGYKCDECGKGFWMWVNIRQHRREVHEGKRVKKKNS